MPAFHPDAFRRHDESDDTLFYDEPRLVVHIDDNAIAALRDYYGQVLPADSLVLDLMSSWRSHLPDGAPNRRVVGLGLNQVELNENPQLHERVVHNLNANLILPFPDMHFDAAVVTVSIQYITHPVETFHELNRILKPGASFHVAYSNRMFPTKAVAIWQSLSDRGHGELIKEYFALAGGWTPAEWLDITPQAAGYTDPIFVVKATKL